MNGVPDELVQYARDIAPHIDRLAIAVHRHGRPAGMALMREFGLPNAGILVDARPMLLAGPITLDDLAAAERFASRESLAVALEEHVRQGLLERDDADSTPAYSSTSHGRDLLLRLTELQGQTITALWAVHAALLPALASFATYVVDYAAATLSLDRYPAFRTQHAAPAPLGATPAHLLLTRLTTLRYLRADAHALALAAHSLDSAQAHALARLWRATEPLRLADIFQNGDPEIKRAALQNLRDRGLANTDGEEWRISAAGRTRRDAIEEQTNRLAAPPFAALDADDRAAFLHGLAALSD